MQLQRATPKNLFKPIIILIFGIAIGHFLPMGILVIPVTISLITGIIIFVDNGFNILIKSVLCYLFIGLNDIGIKLFAGGIHDMEGIGWIHMLLFIGLVPSFIILLTKVLRDKSSTNWMKAISILIFILLIFIHLQIFETLGVHTS